MKKLLTLLLLILPPLPLLAQIGYFGKVLSNGKGVADIVVKISSEEDTFGVMTDQEGGFLFLLSANDTTTHLRFSIDLPEYAPLDTLCSLKSDLTFHLAPRAKELGEAVVKGQRIFERNEGNVRSYQPNLKGLTKYAKAEKALRQVPALSYQNESFIIPGKDGAVTFFINGREVNELQVQAIDAKDILRIEVQDYDYKNDLPNGSVNLVLREKKERLFYTEIDGSTAFLQKHFSLSPKIAYYSGDLVVSFVGSYHNMLQKPTLENTRIFSKDSTDYYRSEGRYANWQHSSDLCAMWAINDKNNLSFDYYLFGMYSHMYRDIQQGGNFFATLNHKNFLVHNATLVFRHTLTSRSRLYIKGWSNVYSDKFTDARYPDDARSRTQTFAAQANIETDKVAIGTTQHDLSYGYKSIFRQNSIHGATEKPYSTIHQLFLVDEFRLASQLTGVASLRADYAQIGTQAFKKHFFDLLPQLSFKYVNKKWGNWSIGYEAAVYRPAADYLNPAIKRENDFSAVQGNPHLLPERAQKLTFGYSKTIAKTHLSFSASHTFGKEQIRDIYEAAGKYNVYTYANIGSENTTRLSLSLYRTFAGGRMTLNGGATLTRANYYLPTRAGLLSLDNRGWGTNVFLNGSYVTTKEWNYELSMDFYDRRISATRTTRTYRPSFGLSVEKEVGKHWAFRMSLSDYTPTLHQTYFLKGVQQTQKTIFDGVNISIGVRYRLGKPFQAGVDATDEGAADLKTAR